MIDPWVGQIPWRKESLPTPVFWPGEFHGLHSPWGHKESDRTETFNFTEASGFPCSSVGKESACNAGDPGSIFGSGRSPGEGIGYPLQYSWASLVAQTVKNQPAMQETWVQSLDWEDPLEEGMATHSSILAWRISMNCSPPGSSVHGDFTGTNTGLGCHALLQGIFPTQGPNPGLPHCRWILYQLSHKGSPRILEWVAYPFSSRSS